MLFESYWVWFCSLSNVTGGHQIFVMVITAQWHYVDETNEWTQVLASNALGKMLYFQVSNLKRSENSLMRFKMKAKHYDTKPNLFWTSSEGNLWHPRWGQTEEITLRCVMVGEMSSHLPRTVFIFLLLSSSIQTNIFLQILQVNR